MLHYTVMAEAVRFCASSGRPVYGFNLVFVLSSTCVSSPVCICLSLRVGGCIAPVRGLGRRGPAVEDTLTSYTTEMIRYDRYMK
jgi:hypothetical protein